MARNKIKSATDQRKFTIVYNDFLESDLLNYYEKMIFIALKKYADNSTLKAFPSLSTLHKITGISVSQLRRSIDHMEQIGVLSVEHRTDKVKGHQSNVYTLFDYAEMWGTCSKDDVSAVADKINEAKLIAELRSRGYTVTKEKELASEPTKAQTQALKLNHLDNDNISKHAQKSQEAERYSLDQVKQIYDYETMIHDRPLCQKDIDAAINILHTAINCTKDTIRIGGEDKPIMTVIGKLLKLEYPEILYCIDKFSEQTDRIKNPTGYMLTMLFNSKEQMHLDIINQVNNH